jgi:hypothetical protein
MVEFMNKRKDIVESATQLYQTKVNNSFDDPLNQIYNGNISFFLRDVLVSSLLFRHIENGKIYVSRDDIDIQIVLDGLQQLQKEGYIKG